MKPVKSNVLRQAIQQRKKREKGLCLKCSCPSENARCDNCARPAKKRYTKKSQWLAVDWSMTNMQIAKLLGVGRNTVILKRNAYGKKFTQIILQLRDELQAANERAENA